LWGTERLSPLADDLGALGHPHFGVVAGHEGLQVAGVVGHELLSGEVGDSGHGGSIGRATRAGE
jgi:hypothetical protein